MKPLTDYIISFINKYEAKPLNPSSLQSLGLDLMWAAGDINKLRDRMAKTEYEDGRYPLWLYQRHKQTSSVLKNTCKSNAWAPLKTEPFHF